MSDEGVDIVAGGGNPTGDPFLDIALREAREDADMFGRPRDAKYVMSRARELFLTTLGADDEEPPATPEFIERGAAVKLADELVHIEVKRRLAEAGVKEPEQAESTEVIEKRVAERMRKEGWIMRSEVDSIIERRSDQKAVVKAKDTFSWMKCMVIAIVNCMVTPWMPDEWAPYWGLAFVSVYLVLTLRIMRKWKKVVAAMEERIGEKVDPEDLSIQKPVKLPGD